MHLYHDVGVGLQLIINTEFGLMTSQIYATVHSVAIETRS